jgi:hypothetical protein
MGPYFDLIIELISSLFRLAGEPFPLGLLEMLLVGLLDLPLIFFESSLMEGAIGLTSIFIYIRALIFGFD